MIAEPRHLEKLAFRYRQSDGQDTSAFAEIRSSLNDELVDWARWRLGEQRSTDANGIVDLAFAELNNLILDRHQPLQAVRAWMYSNVWGRIPMECNSAHDPAQ